MKDRLSLRCSQGGQKSRSFLIAEKDFCGSKRIVYVYDVEARLDRADSASVKRGELMRPVGIVRRVDQLGRVVLPKSLRKHYQMNEGDPVEIFVQGDHIILERFRPKCVFCSESKDIIDFREKHICSTCLNEMKHVKRDHTPSS